MRASILHSRLAVCGVAIAVVGAASALIFGGAWIRGRPAVEDLCGRDLASAWAEMRNGTLDGEPGTAKHVMAQVAGQLGLQARIEDRVRTIGSAAVEEWRTSWSSMSRADRDAAAELLHCVKCDASLRIATQVTRDEWAQMTPPARGGVARALIEHWPSDVELAELARVYLRDNDYNVRKRCLSAMSRARRELCSVYLDWLAEVARGDPRKEFGFAAADILSDPRTRARVRTGDVNGPQRCE